MTEDDKTSSEVEPQKGRKAAKPKAKRSKTKKKPAREKGRPTGASAYPRHSVRKALRIPKAILEQNTGKDYTDREAARLAGLSYSGALGVEISSSIKYGLLDRPTGGNVAVTDLSKRILRPQNPEDELEGLRQAVLNSQPISDVYMHYRGENIPDEPFFRNALVDTFKLPEDKVDEFKSIFLEDLSEAQLIEDIGSKKRVIDIARDAEDGSASDDTLKKISKGVKIEHGDTCFVMMPFADPIGGYYKLVYEPAITKAGLRAVRADDEIFATGKIIDQIWSGIMAAKVLVAELTGRSPNVFYELGLAHALNKPVVLISSNQEDVPFDLQHIRVIYYDMRDPFWGEKLIAKVSENIVSALKNPSEALLKRVAG